MNNMTTAILPATGSLVSKDKKSKLDFTKSGNDFEFVVYDGEPNPVEGYTKVNFKKRNGNKVLMNYDQFVSYLYNEGFIDDKLEFGGELKAGITTEMEHKDTIEKFKRPEISDKEIAKSIAEDHLKEDPNYYTKLSEMEGKMALGANVGSFSDSTRRDMLDDLHELDMWKSFSDGRWYRKFIIPNDSRARDFMDNGIKERVEDIDGGMLSVILSVPSESESNRVSQVFMETYPVGSKSNKTEMTSNTTVETTNVAHEISTKLSDYKNPYEINRAIEKLLGIKGNQPEAYTPEEIRFIGAYSGYGGLDKIGTFTDDELKTILYEYYTPDEIVKKMWGLAYKYGYGGIGDNSVFEPSVGVGAFLKYAPDNVFIAANEINPYSAMICDILYPHVHTTLQPFEKNFIKKNLSIKGKVDDLKKYSLLIGNPPYGRLNGFYFGMGESDYSEAANFTEYFIFRGLDMLQKGGLLIYVVGAEQYNGGTLFLDSKISKVKKAIFEKAELMDAYRLPNKVFERTGVSSEIIVLKKR